MSTTECYNNYMTTLSDDRFSDVIFHCKDGNVFSQKLLLASSSRLLHELIQDNRNHNCKEVSIYLPDYSKHTVSLLLMLLQHGEIVAEQCELMEVLILVKLLCMEKVKEVSMVVVDLQEDLNISSLSEPKQLKILVPGPNIGTMPSVNIEEESNVLLDEETYETISKEMHQLFTSKGKVKKCYVCTLCGKVFKHKGNLIRHNRSHKDIRLFVCDLCKKRFRTKYNMQDHMLTHTKEQNYQCEICSRKFAVKSSLVRHQITHTSVRQHKCEICDKKFRFKQTLNTHRKIHTGEKPFRCELCGHMFRQSNQLTTHRRKIHCQNEVMSAREDVLTD